MKRKVATVLLVPNSLLWEGLARLLSTTEYKPVRCASCVEELTHGPAFDAKKALFIISWDACARASDADAPLREVQLLRDRYPDAYLIILSDVCNVDDVIATLRAGANGYIMNSMTCDMLTKSFDLVMSGETVLPSEFTRALYDRKSPTLKITAPRARPEPVDVVDVDDPLQRANGVTEMRKLSGREMAIMSRLIRGDSNKSIARGIGLAEATVKTHVKAILRKIGVKNRTQAALWAVTNLGASSESSPNPSLQNGSLREPEPVCE